MFSDKSFDVVQFKSNWKKERSSDDAGAQTEDLSFHEESSQTATSSSVEVQTDSVQGASESVPEVDYDRLAAWLNRICPKVLKELDRSQRSRAFDGYQPPEDGSDQQLKLLLTRKPPQADVKLELKASAVAWSCTGAVAAVGYSVAQHDSWCDHVGSVQLVNVNCTKTPGRALTTSACVSTLAAHPAEPSVLAAGTRSGEIVVWGLSRDGDSVLGTSTLHQDAVAQLAWVRSPDSRGGFLLASCSGDGRVLLWQVSLLTGGLSLSDSFAIALEHGAPRLQESPLGGSAATELGVSCFSFSPHESATFVVGAEGGAVLRCSLLSNKPAGVRSELQLKDPVLGTFDRHQGAVTCVQFSPHHDDIFLSTGTDHEVRVYSLKQVAPVQVICPDGEVLGAWWNPTAKYLLTVWGAGGTVDTFHLHTRVHLPPLQIASPERPAPLSVVSFNTHSPRLVAAGDMQGRFMVWQLPHSQQEPKL